MNQVEADDKWIQIKNSLKEAAEEIIGIKDRNRIQKEWITSKC